MSVIKQYNHTALAFCATLSTARGGKRNKRIHSEHFVCALIGHFNLCGETEDRKVGRRKLGSFRCRIRKKKKTIKKQMSLRVSSSGSIIDVLLFLKSFLLLGSPKNRAARILCKYI